MVEKPKRQERVTIYIYASAYKFGWYMHVTKKKERARETKIERCLRTITVRRARDKSCRKMRGFRSRTISLFFFYSVTDCLIVLSTLVMNCILFYNWLLLSIRVLKRANTMFGILST